MSTVRKVVFRGAKNEAHTSFVQAAYLIESVMIHFHEKLYDELRKSVTPFCVRLDPERPDEYSFLRRQYDLAGALPKPAHILYQAWQYAQTVADEAYKAHRKIDTGKQEMGDYHGPHREILSEDFFASHKLVSRGLSGLFQPAIRVWRIKGEDLPTWVREDTDAIRDLTYLVLGKANYCLSEEYCRGTEGNGTHTKEALSSILDVADAVGALISDITAYLPDVNLSPKYVIETSVGKALDSIQKDLRNILRRHGSVLHLYCGTTARDLENLQGLLYTFGAQTSGRRMEAVPLRAPAFLKRQNH